MKSFTETLDRRACIDALAEIFGGEHHLPDVKEFGTGVCINHHGSLATFDFDELTRLVIVAHKRAVRLSIASSGPGMIRIIAHKRIHSATAGFSQRHPSLSDLAEIIEKETEK